MNFAKRGDRLRVQQKFDAKNQYIIKAGKKINQYKMIQAASEDTDLYKTLEKYGSLEKLELNKEGVYGEFTKIMDMRDLHEQQQKAKELWENLPLNVRNEFHNDRLEFMQNGQKWLEDKIKAENAIQAKKTEKTDKKEEIKTNEQKQ